VGLRKAMLLCGLIGRPVSVLAGQCRVWARVFCFVVAVVVVLPLVYW